MNKPAVLSKCSRLESLRQRLLDTASYLKGVAAIVEGLNKGAADQMEVAINAVQAVGNDLVATEDECPVMRGAFDEASPQHANPMKAATLTEAATGTENRRRSYDTSCRM